MLTCPICRSTAEEIEPGFFDGKTFRCPNHGEFDVSGSVLNTPALMDADMAQWDVALRIATDRATPGKRPRILTSDF
jgi:hypothetical protein